jgi:hypothetical protein
MLISAKYVLGPVEGLFGQLLTHNPLTGSPKVPNIDGHGLTHKFVEESPK